MPRYGESKDAVEAWTCAANLRLYDEDPGPRWVNVGSAVEPRWVDRYDALVDLYARQMLVQLDADPERLIVAARECRVRARQQRQWWTGSPAAGTSQGRCLAGVGGNTD